ncbi:MAG: hypothetical protein WC515_01955 [Candidatus Omnitrophota bacterium]
MRASICIISSILFIASASSLFAETGRLESYLEFGRKGSSGLVEEEDLGDEFDYLKYNIKFSQKLKDDASYYVKYQHYKKDFDTLQGLSNNFDYAAVGLEAPLYSNDLYSVRIGPDFEFKDKDYNDAYDLNYDQFKLDFPITFKKEKDWTVRVNGGINSYHYPDAPKDQFKINSKINVTKKFLDERLEVAAFYKLQYIEREKIANRLERTCGGSFEFKLELPFVRTFEAGIEEGMDNTIIYEEREDSYDFRYFNWHLKTKHSFSDRIKTNFKYVNMTRQYADFDHNFGGFIFENNWSCRAFEIKDHTLDLKFTYFHKQFRFPYVSNPYNIHNDNVIPEIEFEKKRDWRFTASPEVRFYNFPARRSKDKNYYIFKLSMEKWLFKESFLVGFDYRYTFKNYRHLPDIIEDLFRIRAEYKF